MVLVLEEDIRDWIWERLRKVEARLSPRVIPVLKAGFYNH
jgi:hypothetical protein